MIDTERTFTVASDASLVELIRRASRRLIVISPALTDPVAAALAGRLHDLGQLAITVVLDADPEVYRLGYGTFSALEKLRQVSKQSLFDLRVQPGLRIGVVISDEITLLFAPVPMLIEAGSTAIDKPNAIIVTGRTTECVADATGAGAANSGKKQEIGTEALEPNMVKALEQDLKINPPQPFDVARALRVFSSRVQYVELEVANYRLSSRQVQLPSELLDITDDELKSQISSRIRTPASELGKFTINVDTGTGVKPLEIDEQWLTRERKRLEDDCTFPIPKFGRVILSTDRERFEKEVARYRQVVTDYQKAVVDALEKVQDDFERRLIKEYLPRWESKPPGKLTRFIPSPTTKEIEDYLRDVAKRLFSEAVNFAPPEVRVLYKNIAPESVRDPAFLKPLQSIMQRRGVPRHVIEDLFSSGDVAPTAGGLKANWD